MYSRRRTLIRDWTNRFRADVRAVSLFRHQENPDRNEEGGGQYTEEEPVGHYVALWYTKVVLILYKEALQGVVQDGPNSLFVVPDAVASD